MPKITHRLHPDRGFVLNSSRDTPYNPIVAKVHATTRQTMMSITRNGNRNTVRKAVCKNRNSIIVHLLIITIIKTWKFKEYEYVILKDAIRYKGQVRPNKNGIVLLQHYVIV